MAFFQKAKLAMQRRLNSQTSSEDAEAAASSEAVEGNESAQSAQAAQAEQSAIKRTGAQGLLPGQGFPRYPGAPVPQIEQGTIKLTGAHGSSVEQGAIKRTGAQGSRVGQDAIRSTAEQAAQEPIVGPDTLRRAKALGAQIQQCAMMSSGAQTSLIGLGAIRRTEAQKGSQGPVLGPDTPTRTKILGSQIEQSAMKRTGAPGSRVGQGAIRHNEAQAAQGPVVGQDTVRRAEALGAQIEQDAIKRTGAQGSPVRQDTVRRAEALGAQMEQGAMKRTGAQGSPVRQDTVRRAEALGAQMEQGAIKRTGAQGSPVRQDTVRRAEALGAQMEQGAMKRTGAQGSPVRQDTVRRAEALGAQMEQGAIKRTGAQGSPVRQDTVGLMEVQRGLEDLIVGPETRKRAEALGAHIQQCAMMSSGGQTSRLKQAAKRRTQAQAAQGSPVGQDTVRRAEALGAQMEQGAIKRTGAQGSPVRQDTVRRAEALGAQMEQGAIKHTGAQGSPVRQDTVGLMEVQRGLEDLIVGPETRKRAEALGAHIQQCAMMSSGGQTSRLKQAAKRRTQAQAAQGSPVGQDTVRRAEALGAQMEQGAIQRTGAQGSPVRQDTVRRAEALGAQMEQGAIKRTGAQGSPVGQGAIRRTGAQALQGSPFGQIEQGTLRRTELQDSRYEMRNSRRPEVFAPPLERGRLGRPETEGSPKPFSGSPFWSPLARKKPGHLEVLNEEALLRPLARFSKFSAARYGATRKGPESWARTTRDRHQRNPEPDDGAREVTISREQRTVQPASTMVPHGVNPDYPKPIEFLHQARSYPGRSSARLNRSPSVSSQGSLDSNKTNQGSDHGGSSSQTRFYSPERRELLDTASGYTPPTSSSHRSASLDTPREARTQSSSQGSLLGGSPRILPTFRLMSDHSSPNPYGTLQPELYMPKSPVFLKLSGCGPTLGRLHVRLKYDFQESDLIVHLIEIHNLAMGEKTGFTEPYVRLEIVPPIDSNKRESHHVVNNSNPYYDEQFRFSMTHDELWDSTLVFQIRDHDRFSRFDMFGDVKMEMTDVEFISSSEVWSEISRCKKPKEEYQELFISLSFLPIAQRLTVVILKGRNLYVNPRKGSVDPYVKINLGTAGRREKRSKTNTRKDNRNPVWNEAAAFDLSLFAFPLSFVEIMVYDESQELMSSDELIGSFTIGFQEENRERDHWKEVFKAPRKTIAMWHTLR